MDKIGKYQILEQLGHGGMGTVYKAMDPLIERVVALKTISANLDSQPELRARFFREGRSAGQLSHKNIITIYDLGEDEGVAYMAMEYLKGFDLKARILNKEPMTLRRKLQIMVEVCDGLVHAHSKNVIHRDIKPANIFITDAGEVKILDFGLARMISSELTQTGLAMGTPNYMSPEQVRGIKTDSRTDIFSCGVLLYELLSYRKPFQGDSFTSTIFKILQENPESLDNSDTIVPRALAAIVYKALEKDRDLRYQSVIEMLHALNQFRGSQEFSLIADQEMVPTSSTHGLQEDRGSSQSLLPTGLSQALAGGSSAGSLKDHGSAVPLTSSHRALVVSGSDGTEPYGRPEEAVAVGAASSSSIPPHEFSSSTLGSKVRIALTVAASAISKVRIAVTVLGLAVIFVAAWLVLRDRILSHNPTQVSTSLANKPSVPFENRRPTAAIPSALPVANNDGSQPEHKQPLADHAPANPPLPEASKGVNAETARPPKNAPDSEIKRRTQESGDLVNNGKTKARSLMTASKDQEAAASVGKVLKASPPDSQAERRATQLNQEAKKSAEEALAMMEAAKVGAEKSQAADLAPKSLESARDVEVAGVQFLQGGQYEKAAMKLLESAARYRGTEVEARAESNARAERIRRAESEKQRNQLLARLNAARQNYEGERAKALEAGIESRAPDKYRDVLKMAAEAESKAGKGDLEGAQKSFENAAGVVQQSGALAADLARAEASHPAKEPPKPAGEVTRPAATPQQLISDLLGRYKNAMENKNIRLLNNLWPSLHGTPQETAVSNEFQIARSLQIDFQNVEIRAEGESATASGKRLSQIKTFDGRNLRSESSIAFKLRKSGGNWIIEAVRFE